MQFAKMSYLLAQINPNQIVYLPVDKIHHYGGLVMHVKNSWWSVHPEKGLIFYARSSRRPSLEDASPQCNSSEETSRMLTAKLWPGAECRFFESVLYPVNVHDYA